MLKPCPECRATMNAETPYCDSCGCALPPAKLPRDLKVFLGAVAMLSAVIVAVAFVRSFVG